MILNKAVKEKEGFTNRYHHLAREIVRKCSHEQKNCMERKNSCRQVKLIRSDNHIQARIKQLLVRRSDLHSFQEYNIFSATKRAKKKGEKRCVHFNLTEECEK